MPDILNWVPPDWRGPMALAVLILGACVLLPFRRQLGAAVVARLGGAVPAPPTEPPPPCAPCSPAAPDEGEKVDNRLWREIDLMASGLPWPIIGIDRKHRVMVYNRPAEALTGHPWNAAHGADVGHLLQDTDAAVLRRDLDDYLHERLSGDDALRMVAERRILHVERPGGDVVRTEAIITDFGNGHGGWQIALTQLQLEPS